MTQLLSRVVVRRATAQMNYMAQDRFDLFVAARVTSLYVSKPREETVPVIERATRHFKRYPRYRLVVSNSAPWKFERQWANDLTTSKSCSGGYIQVNGVTVGHCSKKQLTRL